MPGRILLVTDDVSFTALYARSDLPPWWFVNADLTTAVTQAEKSGPLLLRCAHDQFLVPEGISQDSAFDSGSRTELINSFLDATICYLAVVGGRNRKRRRRPAFSVFATIHPHGTRRLVSAVSRRWSRNVRRRGTLLFDMCWC